MPRLVASRGILLRLSRLACTEPTDTRAIVSENPQKIPTAAVTSTKAPARAESPLLAAPEAGAEVSLAGGAVPCAAPAEVGVYYVQIDVDD